MDAFHAASAGAFCLGLEDPRRHGRSRARQGQHRAARHDRGRAEGIPSDPARPGRGWGRNPCPADRADAARRHHQAARLGARRRGHLYALYRHRPVAAAAAGRRALDGAARPLRRDPGGVRVVVRLLLVRAPHRPGLPVIGRGPGISELVSGPVLPHRDRAAPGAPRFQPLSRARCRRASRGAPRAADLRRRVARADDHVQRHPRVYDDLRRARRPRVDEFSQPLSDADDRRHHVA